MMLWRPPLSWICGAISTLLGGSWEASRVSHRENKGGMKKAPTQENNGNEPLLARPSLEFLHACSAQLKADVLSVIFKTTGCGSVVGGVADTMWRVA